MGDEVTGVRLKLDDMYQAWNVARDLAERARRHYRVSDWTSEHANFFRAIKMEKMVMFVILLADRRGGAPSTWCRRW